MTDSDFLRLIFAGVIAMQYHPRNDVQPEDDLQVIDRCVDIAVLAAYRFNKFERGDI